MQDHDTQYAYPVRTSELAIWAVVCGGLSFCCCGPCTGVPAIILGLLALDKIRHDPHLTGHGVAVAGIVLGALSILLSILYTLLHLLIVAANPDFLNSLDL